MLIWFSTFFHTHFIKMILAKFTKSHTLLQQPNFLKPVKKGKLFIVKTYQKRCFFIKNLFGFFGLFLIKYRQKRLKITFLTDYFFKFGSFIGWFLKAQLQPYSPLASNSLQIFLFWKCCTYLSCLNFPAFELFEV